MWTHWGTAARMYQKAAKSSSERNWEGAEEGTGHFHRAGVLRPLRNTKASGFFQKRRAAPLAGTPPAWFRMGSSHSLGPLVGLK